MDKTQAKLNIIDISAPDFCDNGAAVKDIKKLTHACAPSHMIEEAPSLRDIPAQCFVGECKVVNVNEFITGASVEQMYLYGCERVIFRGEGKASLMQAAAEELSALGVKLIGTDSAALSSGDDARCVYETLFDSGCCVIENLDLSEVRESGDYFLIAPPAKVGESGIAPVRALLVKDYLYWNKPELYGFGNPEEL